MMGVAQARRLARFRASERRVAAADLSAATGAVLDAEARVEQIVGLASAVAVRAGDIMGAGLAARGEFVGRLLAGQIVATVQRDRRAGDVDEARRGLGLADARAGFAERGLAAAERLDSSAAERRAVLKAPCRRIGT